MPTKRCTQCRCEKPVTAFYMRTNRHGVRMPTAECRQCRSLRAQATTKSARRCSVPSEHKECSTCKTMLPMHRFGTRRGRPTPECKLCRNARQNPRKYSGYRTITYEYDFARTVLGYSHMKTAQWLAEKYAGEFAVTDLLKWGLTPERSAMWQPDPQ